MSAEVQVPQRKDKIENGNDKNDSQNTNNLLKPGELVKDRWRVIQKLGGGGFGEIYEAIDTWADAYLHKYPNRYLCQACLTKHPLEPELKSIASPNSASQFNTDSGIASDKNGLCPPRISSAGTTTSAYTTSGSLGNRMIGSKLLCTSDLPTPRSLSGKTVPISPMCINCAAEININACDDMYATSSDSGFSNASSLSLEHYKVAIKAESSRQPRQVLRMEVAVLRRLKGREHICQLLGCGKNTRINYMVMTLESKNLAELRRSVPKGIFTMSTAFRVILQCLKALRILHEVGFLHRDIKPSNFTVGRGSLGQGDPLVKLLDFGLARAYTVNGKDQLRPPRPMAGFRGTVRYASMNAHRQQDLSRYDDIWSLTYMLLEFINGNLPWRRVRDKDEVGRMKLEVNNFKLAITMGLPERVASVWIGQLELMDFYSTPDYNQLEKVISDWLGEYSKPEELYDWQSTPDSNLSQQQPHSMSTAAPSSNRGDEKDQKTVNQEQAKVPMQIVDCNLPPLTPRTRPPLSMIRKNLHLSQNASRLKNGPKSTSTNSLDRSPCKVSQSGDTQRIMIPGHSMHSITKTLPKRQGSEYKSPRANRDFSRNSCDFATGLTNRSSSFQAMNNIFDDSCASINRTSSIQFESMLAMSKNSQPSLFAGREYTPPTLHRFALNTRPQSASGDAKSRQHRRIPTFKEANFNTRRPGSAQGRPQTSPAKTNSPVRMYNNNNRAPLHENEHSIMQQQVDVSATPNDKEPVADSARDQRSNSVHMSGPPNMDMKITGSPIPKPRRRSLAPIFHEEKSERQQANPRELLKKAYECSPHEAETLNMKILSTIKKPLVKVNGNSIRNSFGKVLEEQKVLTPIHRVDQVKALSGVKTFPVRQQFVKRSPDTSVQSRTGSARLRMAKASNSESESHSIADQSQTSLRSSPANKSRFMRAQSADHLARNARTPLTRRDSGDLNSTITPQPQPSQNIAKGRIRTNSLTLGGPQASRIPSLIRSPSFASKR